MQVLQLMLPPASVAPQPMLMGCGGWLFRWGSDAVEVTVLRLLVPLYSGFYNWVCLMTPFSPRGPESPRCSSLTLPPLRASSLLFSPPRWLQGLAKAIAWDGEGATCLMEIQVQGSGGCVGAGHDMNPLMDHGAAWWEG